MTAELVSSYAERDLPPDADAKFEAFYHRYHPCLVGYATKVFGGADAEDIAQETMARAYQYFTRLDPGRDPWPWLSVVARHVGTDVVRAHARVVSVEDQQLAEVPSPDGEAPFERVLAADDRRLLWRAFSMLSPGDRRVLRLREYDDLSSSDIAALLETNENTVRQHLHRARARLRERYRAVGGGLSAVTPLVLLRTVRHRLGRHAARVGHGVGTATGGMVALGSTIVAVSTGAPAVTPAERPAVAVVTTVTSAALTDGDLLAVRMAAAQRAAVTTARPAGDRGTVTQPAPQRKRVGPAEYEVENEIDPNVLSPGSTTYRRIGVYLFDRRIVSIDGEFSRSGPVSNACTTDIVRCE